MIIFRHWINNISVIGLGYIGLPTATILAKSGYNVLGVDINENIIKSLNQGKIHIVEPDLKNLLKEEFVLAQKFFDVLEGFKAEYV